jgi:diaminopimelate decarboxylase
MTQRKYPLTIYISGLYSGPNPSPGIGIARSLRCAYPDAILIGVDYSNRSHGIHWPDFDEIWLQRPWNELDLDLYASQIKEVLDAGAFWISGLDLETIWLVHKFPTHSNLLGPSVDALRRIAKPTIPAHKALPLRVPHYLYLTLPDWEIYAFCRKYGWRVWLKGPYYEACRVRNWTELNFARSQLSNTWSTDELFVQAHIVGYEESIAFCAYRGHLLDCVYMTKRDITPEGKTWAGRISNVPKDILDPLQKVVKELNWTGGAELEMIRDANGMLWLIEWNPRFPAWIYGATIARHNLPALLIERASGMPARKNLEANKEFTRVVIEIPARPQFPLPPLSEPVADSFGSSLKHPSGMPLLAARLQKHKGEVLRVHLDEIHEIGEISAPSIPHLILEELKSYDFTQVETPLPLFLKAVAETSFKQTDEIIRANSSRVQVAVAYSVKTNPDARFLELAHKHDFLAEIISQFELRKALSIGFDPAQIVLNGPGKWWPSISNRGLQFHAIFCDSLEELRWLIPQLDKGICGARFVGVRLRPPQSQSRFGVPVGDLGTFRNLVSLIKRIPPDCSFGVHFHIPSSTIGIEEWFQLYESILMWARAIETTSGVKVRCVDVGGGWFPDDWFDLLLPRLSGLIDKALGNLPSLEHLILEPGKALTQSAVALLTRVLEVRRSGSNIEEVVVDGSIAELPEAQHYPHRILCLSMKGEWEVLKRGKGLLLGRLCMENDILARDVGFPDSIQPGDILVICDAGAYDRSMSYAFGQG